MAFCSLALGAQAGNVVEEVKAAQVRFIGDINNGDYAKVVAAFHESYKGLISDKGFMTLDYRRNVFKERFASPNHGTITILETEVRPLGNDYAMLRSHIKLDKKGAEPRDWWYTAIYLRSGGQWKVIHEQ